MRSSGQFVRFLLGASSVLWLSACGTSAPAPVVLTSEAFPQESQYSHDFPVSASATCEAARRALLNSGYIIDKAKPEFVDGRKSFQPTPETHVEVEFHIVCAAFGKQDHRAVAFVSAVQERYALKKISTAASLGVGTLGALSLPVSSTDDALVKVASETVTDKSFYDRFFDLLTLYVNPDQEIPKGGYEDAGPVPPPKPGSLHVE